MRHLQFNAALHGKWAAVHPAATPPPPFRGPGFPKSARNISPNQWISDSGDENDHLLKVFVLW